MKINFSDGWIFSIKFNKEDKEIWISVRKEDKIIVAPYECRIGIPIKISR